jgi:hypothetical protein
MRHREDTAVAGSASQSSRGTIIFPVEIVRLNDDKHLTEMEWLRNGRQERDHNRRIQAGLFNAGRHLQVLPRRLSQADGELTCRSRLSAEATIVNSKKGEG